MKLSLFLTLVGLTTPLALAGLTEARRLASDAAMIGDATTATTAEACLRVRADLADELSDKHSDLHKLLTKCTRPLLYLSPKWTSPSDAIAYCKSDACQKLVKELRAAAPRCAWTALPSDSPDALLTAQRVLEDCADA